MPEFVIETNRGILHKTKEGEFYFGGNKNVKVAVYETEEEAKKELEIAREQLQKRMIFNHPRHYSIIEA